MPTQAEVALATTPTKVADGSVTALATGAGSPSTTVAPALATGAEDPDNTIEAWKNKAELRYKEIGTLRKARDDARAQIDAVKQAFGLADDSAQAVPDAVAAKLAQTEKERNAAKLDVIIAIAASRAGVKDIDAALKLVDRSLVHVGEDGTIDAKPALDSLVDAARKIISAAPVPLATVTPAATGASATGQPARPDGPDALSEERLRGVSTEELHAITLKLINKPKVYAPMPTGS
jgi:hypothetical protein